MCYQLQAKSLIKLALYELGIDVVITCAAYFIADIDGEWDSFEVETFVACLAKTVFDGISLGFSIYNFSKMQKLILTDINDGASIVVSSDDTTISLTKDLDDALDEGLGTYGVQKGIILWQNLHLGETMRMMLTMHFL